MAEPAKKVRLASNFEVLCIQYHSNVDGIHNIAAFTKWNEWTQTFQIIDDIEIPEFGVIDSRVLDVAADGFLQYDSMIFEGTSYMEDDEVQEMFNEYVATCFTCFTDETITFCKWTRAMVYVTLEVSGV